MDFVQRLDSSKLLLAETILSFVVSPFAAPPYNLPIFLFGTYVQEARNGTSSLQTFTGLLGGSMLFDLIWMSKNEQNGFITFLTIVLLLLKVPTFLAFGTVLREQGSHFSGPPSDGQTAWSIPGAFNFSDRAGYQVVEEGGFVRSSKQVAPAPPNSPGQSHALPGAYQSV